MAQSLSRWAKKGKGGAAPCWICPGTWRGKLPATGVSHGGRVGRLSRVSKLPSPAPRSHNSSLVKTPSLRLPPATALGKPVYPYAFGVPLWHPQCTWVWVPVAHFPWDHPGLPTTDHTLPPRKTWISLKVYRFNQTSSNNSHGRTPYTWGWSLNFLSLLFPCHTDYIHNLISSHSILKRLIF